MKVGDRIHVASIGTGTVREVRNGSRYLVEVKGHSIVVSEDQIQPADPPKERRTKLPSVAGERGLDAEDALGSTTVATLDLHGKTTLEAIAALDTFLNEVLVHGARTAHVIHGRSGGRIKAAVHRRLKQLPSISSFQLHPRNPGVTIVTFS